jgi:muramidase (phage lysozyme)
MLEAITLRTEARLHLPALPVLQEATVDLGKHPAHCVMPVALIPPKEAQPALPVMLEAITLRKEAHPHLPALPVMLEATTLRTEAHPHLPALPVMQEATVDLGRHPAHCVMPVALIPPKEAQPALPVMLEAITLRKEARPHLPALPVLQEATVDLGKHPAHCVMPVALIPPKEAQPALPVMLEAITLRKEAHPHLPALPVMLEATTLRTEAHPHLPALPVMQEATVDLGKHPAHCVMPVALIPPKEAQPALLVMLEAITLRKEARLHLPASNVMRDSYAAKEGFLKKCRAPLAITVPAACKRFLVQLARSLRNQVFFL